MAWIWWPAKSSRLKKCTCGGKKAVEAAEASAELPADTVVSILAVEPASDALSLTEPASDARDDARREGAVDRSGGS